MGVVEFNWWCEITTRLNQQRDGATAIEDPGSWHDSTSRRNFDELAERRRKLRGR